jgi:hypothetical protein
MIHHEKNKSGFVICSNELTTRYAGLKDILGKGLVKVYIIHISRIPYFGGEVKDSITASITNKPYYDYIRSYGQMMI